MREIYDWVPWFQELAQKIAEGSESDLAEKAKRVQWKKDDTEKSGLLRYGDENIDPLSFFYTLASQSKSRESRNRIYPSISTEFELSQMLNLDSDEDFIFPTPPVVNTLFHQDGNGDPQLLWEIFRAAVSGFDAVDGDDFENALEIRGIATTNLTQALSLINPKGFLPIDERTKSLRIFDLGTGEISWEEYRQCIERVRNVFRGCELYEVNLFSYLYATGELRIRLDPDPHQHQYPYYQYNAEDESRWSEFDKSNSISDEGGRGRQWMREKEPQPGQIVLARTWTTGRGIGIIWKNDYQGQAIENLGLHVVWLNKLPAQLSGNLSPYEFSWAIVTSDVFQQAEEYAPTFELLERLNSEDKGTTEDPFETAYNGLREGFLKTYPDFSGFKEDKRYMDERMQKDELIRTFKQEIVPKMESGDWESAGDALVKDFVKGTPATKKLDLMGWEYSTYKNYFPNPDDEANFAQKVATLVDENEPLERRIDQFLDFFKESGIQKPLPRARTCSAVSLFLALNDSDGHLASQFRRIKQVVQRFNPEFSWDSQHIQASEIEYVNDLAKRVLERLSAEGWEPKDMFDVQFFFYGAVKGFKGMGNPVSKIVFPKAHPKTGITKKPTTAKNRILYGPPGTGKTWHMVDKALEIIDPEFYESNQSDRRVLKQRFDELRDEKQIGFVTFHQSFSYEDFVEGLRASTKNGKIRYKIEDGLFKRMCDSARQRPDEPWVLIIDEINRGNIANILGELITLIEPSKRAGAEDEIRVDLPYSKEPFSVPSNLHIIGTMNTADRSLAHIDTALRRRFEFEEMLPNAELLAGIEIEGIDIEKMLTTINSRIELLYDRAHTLGHSFFLPLEKNPDLGALKSIFVNRILPLLEEYFFEDWSRIQKVLGDDRKSGKETRFYVPTFSDDRVDQLLGKENEDNQALSGKAFRRNEKALEQAVAWIGIYKEQEPEQKQEPSGQTE